MKSRNIRAAAWKVCAAAALALPVQFAAAQTTYNWINPAGGNFFDSSNWSPTGYPDPATGTDTAVFALNSTYTVGVNNFTNIFNADFTAGNVTVDTTGSGFFFTNTGGVPGQASLNVASDSTGGETASLIITSSDGSGGGSAAISVGAYANNTGTLTIDGQGQPLLFYADFGTAVGFTDDTGDAPGNGTMNVINGANLETSQGYIDGTVHVGTGAVWSNEEVDNRGPTSTLRIGVTGTGNMLVDNTNNDTTATSTDLETNDLVMGVNPGSSGTLTIQGSAQYGYASFTNWFGTTAEIGEQGAALLNLQIGAQATVSSIDIATANRDAIDTGTVDELNVQYDAVLNISGALRVGVADIGTLNIGGTYNSGSTNGTINCNSAIIGVNGPGVATVYFGDSASSGDGPATPLPATLNVTNTLTIGEYPDTATGQSETSTLDIEGGGRVTSGYGVIGDQMDPVNGLSSGAVTIAGVLGLNTTAVSIWQITNDLTIGNYGIGLVTVDQGGELQVGGNIFIAENAVPGEGISSGSLTVEQTDSTNPNGYITTKVFASNLYVGGSATAAGGQGQVAVSGGTLRVSNSAAVYLESTMGVNGTGMIAIGLDANGDIPTPGAGSLIVGASAAGSLTATGGTVLGENEVFADNAIIGDQGVGTVTMNGGFLQSIGIFSYEYTASLQVPGTTIVSNTSSSAGSTLLMENGGSAYPQTLIIGNQAGSSGTVTVTGGSADGYISSYLEVGQTVTVGNYGVGALDIAAGAYASLENAQLAANPGASGTLTVDGSPTHIEVYNTLDTGYGGVVNLTNGGTVEIGAPYVAHPGTVMVGSAGTLAGMGTINANVYLEPYGVISPGETLGVSPGGIVAAVATHVCGILTINGAYEQDSESTLVIDIIGPAPVMADELDITGDATLAGSLDLTFANVVPAGDYLILASAGLTGTFDTVDMYNAPAGAELEYTADDVYVVVPGVPEPAMMSLLAIPLLATRRRRGN